MIFINEIYKKNYKCIFTYGLKKCVQCVFVPHAQLFYHAVRVHAHFHVLYLQNAARLVVHHRRHVHLVRRVSASLYTGHVQHQSSQIWFHLLFLCCLPAGHAEYHLWNRCRTPPQNQFAAHPHYLVVHVLNHAIHHL